MAIRYALAAVKNVGGAAIDSWTAARDRDGPFKSLGGFADRADPHHVNKRLLENLVRAGAFDALHSNRAERFASLETIARPVSAAATEPHRRPGNPFSLNRGRPPARPAPCARLARPTRGRLPGDFAPT